MRLMKFFSDEALAKVAAYYASLDPAPPPEGPAPKYVDPIAAGKAAAAPCAKCHGDNGVSHKEGVPSLVGLHPKYLFETLQSYKSGDRPTDAKNEDMKKALDPLNDQDLQHIALYYALQTDNLTRAQTPNPGGARSPRKRSRFASNATEKAASAPARSRRASRDRTRPTCSTRFAPTRMEPATTTRCRRGQRSSTTSR